MITHHSIQRANERTQYNGKSAVRFIENGVVRGKTASEFKQMERDYLESKSLNGKVAKAYNGFCFIISNDGVCITLYPLPKWFGRQRHYEHKERIRNVKRYPSIKYPNNEEWFS